jgi:hypothetical protein
MELGNFYCSVYMKAGAGVTLTTQGALTTALAGWQHLFACETGVTIGEAKAKDIEFTTGDKFELSKNVDGAITFLEVTEANYQYLRANFNNKACSVILNKVKPSGVGQVVQVQNIIPFIGREFKSGDIVRVKISWSTESSENILDVAELPAA